MQNVVSVHFWPTDPHLGAIVDDELHRSRLREDLRLTFSFFSTKKHFPELNPCFWTSRSNKQIPFDWTLHPRYVHHPLSAKSQQRFDWRTKRQTSGDFWGLETGGVGKKTTCPIQEPSLSPLFCGSRNCRMSWWKVCRNIYIMVLKFQGHSVPHISYTYICSYIPTLRNNKKTHKLRCNIGGIQASASISELFSAHQSFAGKQKLFFIRIYQFKLQEFSPFITFKCIQNTHHQGQGLINNILPK